MSVRKLVEKPCIAAQGVLGQHLALSLVVARLDLLYVARNEATTLVVRRALATAGQLACFGGAERDKLK